MLAGLCNKYNATCLMQITWCSCKRVNSMASVFPSAKKLAFKRSGGSQYVLLWSYMDGFVVYWLYCLKLAYGSGRVFWFCMHWCRCLKLTAILKLNGNCLQVYSHTFIVYLCIFVLRLCIYCFVINLSLHLSGCIVCIHYKTAGWQYVTVFS